MEYKYSKKTLQKKHKDNYNLKRKMLKQFENIKNLFESYTVSIDEYFYYAEEQIDRLEIKIQKLEAINDNK